MLREEKKENIYISSIIQLKKKSMTYVSKLSELNMWGYPPPNRGKPQNMEKLEKSPFTLCNGDTKKNEMRGFGDWEGGG